MLFSISFILVDLLDFPLFLSYFLLIFPHHTHLHCLLAKSVCVCSLRSISFFIFPIERASIFIIRLKLWWYNIYIKVYDFVILQTCFFRQFGRSVVRADYLTLRKGFITVCDILTHTRHSFSLAYDNFTFKHTNVF